MSAREAYLRAYTYHRTATLCLRVSDPRFSATWQTMRLCFRRSAELFAHPSSRSRSPTRGAHCQPTSCVPKPPTRGGRR